MMPVRLEPAALRSRVKHSTTELPGALVILLFSRGEPFVQFWYRVLCDSIKLFKIWASGSDFLSGALGALLFSGAEADSHKIKGFL